MIKYSLIDDFKESIPNLVDMHLQPKSLYPQFAMTSEGQSKPQRYVVIQNGNQPTQPKMTVPKYPELKALEKARIEKLFPKKMRRILGFMQLYLGGIAGLLQIILVGMESTHFGTADWGAKIWCGLVIAGGIGLITHNGPSRKSIEALLVLSIFAWGFAMILVYFSWIGILDSRRGSYIDGVSWNLDSGFQIH